MYFESKVIQKKHRQNICLFSSLALFFLATLFCNVVEAGFTKTETTDGSDDKKTKKKVTFEKDIRPLFSARCASCHNPNKKNGDLDVTNYAALMEGGGSGESITPGDAEDSYLYLLVTHEDSPEMPPETDKIPETEIKLIKDWINQGALENAKSKFVAPKPKVAIAASNNPNVRPKTIPKVCRLSKNVTSDLVRPPVVVASATSPWTPLIAVGGAKSILFYRTDNLSFQGHIPFPEGQLKSLRFEASGQVLVASGGRGAANGVIKVFDLSTGEPISVHSGESDSVLAADVDSTIQMIAFGGPDRLFKSRNVEDNEEIYQKKKHTDWIQAVRFSPDGVLVASGDRNGGLRVWEAESGRDYLDLRGHKGGITSLGWSPDSNLLYSASADGTIKIWEIENGTQVKSVKAHNNGVTQLTINRSGQILSCGRDRVASLWDANGKMIRKWSVGTLPTSVSFCSETSRAFVFGFDGKTRVYSSVDGKQVGTILPAPKPVSKRLLLAKSQQSNLIKQFAPVDSQFKSLNQKVVSLTSAKNIAMTNRKKFEEELKSLNARKSQLEKQLTLAASQLKKADQQLVAMNKQLAAAVKRHTPMKNKLSSFSGLVASLEKELAFDAKLKQLKSQKSKLIQNLESGAEGVESLALNLVESQKQKASFEKAVALAKTNQQNLLKNKSAIEQSMKLARGSMATNQSNLVKKQDLFGKVTKDLQQLGSVVANLQQTIQRNPNNPQLVSALENTKVALKQKQGESKTMETEIANLNGAMNRAKKEIEIGEKKLPELDAALAKKNQEIVDLNQKVQTSSSVVAKLQTDKDQAEKLFQQNRAEFEKVQKEIQSLRQGS